MSGRNEFIGKDFMSLDLFEALQMDGLTVGFSNDNGLFFGERL